jgi:hypothetical protein
MSQIIEHYKKFGYAQKNMVDLAIANCLDVFLLDRGHSDRITTE